MSADNTTSGTPATGADSKSDTHVQQFSSSPLASSVMSDAGSTVAGSASSGNNVAASEVKNPDDEDLVVVPYHGPDRTTYTEDTPPSQFPDWPAYVAFCLQGPKLQILCANEINKDGMPVSYFALDASKKLLCDFGAYFQALYRSGMTETIQNRVVYDDISMENFVRLYLCVLAGNPGARNNLGTQVETMTGLLTVYTLADRFQMTQVREWLRISINDYLNINRAWPSVYNHQVLEDPPVPGAADFHKAKVLDVVSTYLAMIDLPEEIHPITKDQFLGFIVSSCPRDLLIKMWHDLDEEFRLDLGLALLLHSM